MLLQLSSLFVWPNLALIPGFTSILYHYWFISKLNKKEAAWIDPSFCFTPILWKKGDLTVGIWIENRALSRSYRINSVESRESSQQVTRELSCPKTGELSWQVLYSVTIEDSRNHAFILVLGRCCRKKQSGLALTGHHEVKTECKL